MFKLFVLSVLVLYLVIATYAYFAADRQIFFPPSQTYTEDDLDVVMVRTADDVEIATLYLHNPEAEFTILFNHGNAEDLGHLIHILATLRGRGYSVLAYDYRGYGLSQKAAPTADGVYRDVTAVYQYATQKLGIPSSVLIPYGRSVGSGPAVFLAATESVAGLIIEGGFTSAFRVVTYVQLFPFDRFPNLKRIKDVRCPVLIIHGENDRVIPLVHGKKLYVAAPEPKRLLVVPDGGHNDVAESGGDAYWKALDEFSAGISASRAASGESSGGRRGDSPAS